MSADHIVTTYPLNVYHNSIIELTKLKKKKKTLAFYECVPDNLRYHLVRLLILAKYSSDYHSHYDLVDTARLITCINCSKQ